MKKILLDTNTYTKYLLGDKKVIDILEWADIVYMSIFVLGELLAGFRKGSKERKNKNILKNFLAQQEVSILDATWETAEIYGWVKDSLRAKGRPIPHNDLWIASQAIETGSKLVTYDKHFLHIKKVRLWDKVKD